MRGHGEGNLINILLLSPWQGAARHWEGAVYVAGRACGITSEGRGKPGTGVREGGGWEECSAEDPKDGSKGGGGCGTACLGRQSQAISKLGLTLLNL